MLRQAFSAPAAKPHLADAADSDWLLSISLDEPARPVPGSDCWAERGALRCFFHGSLFEREALDGRSLRDYAQLSDAEVLLHAYESNGESAFSRLRGSFVAAIIDGTRSKAIVARDPLGMHPLFYVQSGSYVLFAASPQQLIKQPGISRELNRAALADHLCHRWPDPHETYFAAVRRVPPGRCAILSNGRLSLERYWNPLPDDRPLQWLNDEAVACFDDILDRAVDRCLHNGPTGIFLSGGLDSISVAAIASDRLRGAGQSAPWALSLEFPDPECNERFVQERVAQELGLRQHLISIDKAAGSRPLLISSLELNKEMAAPLLNTWAPAYEALAQTGRRDGIRTILTGIGGDEWLGVSPFFSADLILRGAFAELLHFCGSFQRSSKQNALAIARFTLFTCGLRPILAMLWHRLAPRFHDASRIKRTVASDPAWAVPDHGLRAEQRERARGTLANSDPRHGFYVREMQQGLEHPLISMELEEQYELGTRVGVRFAHPFWDPDLIELLCRLPVRPLIEDGRTKSLLRNRLATRLPKFGLERQRKVLSTAYFVSLIRSTGQALADTAEDFPVLSALGIVDGRALRSIFHRELKRSDPESFELRKIYHALNVEMWARGHTN